MENFKIKKLFLYPCLFALQRVVLILLAITMLTTVSIYSQSDSSDSDNSDNSSDTLFNEIELSVDGVVAVGVDGKVWHYDFDTETFVVGDESDQNGENQTESGSSDSDGELSIEERCIIEKEVIQYSKKSLIDEDEYVDGDIVVIDNKRVMHGRRAIEGPLEERELFIGMGNL
jgi:hypothetical protein